jgi:hypothetical protein
MHHHTIISDRVWTSETRMICTSSVPRDRPSQKYTQYPPFRPHKTVRLAYTQRIPNLELLIIIAPLPIFSTQTSRDSLHKKHSNICTSASQSSLMQLQNDQASCGLKTIDQATSLTLSQPHHCANATAQTPLHKRHPNPPCLKTATQPTIVPRITLFETNQYMPNATKHAMNIKHLPTTEHARSTKSYHAQHQA